MYIVRKTLTGESTPFTFGTLGLEFLVKNFSEQPVLVNFEPITENNESTSIKIPDDCAQIIFSDSYYLKAKKTNTLYVKGTGEVEVQIICH